MEKEKKLARLFFMIKPDGMSRETKIVEMVKPLANIIASRRLDSIEAEKIEMLYDYFISPQFKQRVEAIVGGFTKMRDDLAQEKQAMERIWSKRDKQIDQVMKGTVGLYGDLQGIAGAYLPEIDTLKMPYQLEAGNDDQES